MKPQLSADCKLPADIKTAIRACWELKPEDRPTATKLLALFQQHLAEKTGSSSGSSVAHADKADSTASSSRSGPIG